MGDANRDAQLDLEELVKAVQSHSTGKSGRLTPPAVSWPALRLLTEHFEDSDLSRAARVPVRKIEENAAPVMLRSVPFLDERRSLFDAIAGRPDAGDDGVTISLEQWERWQTSAARSQN